MFQKLGETETPSCCCVRLNGVAARLPLPAAAVNTPAPIAAVTVPGPLGVRSKLYDVPEPANPLTVALVGVMAPAAKSVETSLKVTVTGIGETPVGSVVVEAIVAVGGTVSMTHVTEAFAARALVTVSWMPEPSAVSVRTYVPFVPVEAARPVTVHEIPDPVTLAPAR